MRLVISLDGDTPVPYMVHFHYEDGLLTTHKHPEGATVTRTYCTVHPGACPCETPGAAQGSTACSPKDVFSKFTGRKEAFKRAIAIYPKDIREQLWHEYLAVCKPPKARRAA